MDANVDVLSAGYSSWIQANNVMAACGSATLVKSYGSNILVDCLGPWERDKLIALLAQRGHHPDDISHLVCTHGHPDHAGNLNLFTKAQVHIVGHSVFQGDVYTVHPFDEKKPFECTPSVQVIATPGHTLTDVSVVVSQASRLGRVIIAGDLFESERDLANEQVWLEAGSEDPLLQRVHRTFVLSSADYIVPGHGPMFRVPK
ncbi:Metallo-beta-lactamase domain-containing protein 1 [Halotydeus destructor]|nr:Metallo-beta-lactamase domain-containing protein 1 [Halotydeus destructor]